MWGGGTARAGIRPAPRVVSLLLMKNALMTAPTGGQDMKYMCSVLYSCLTWILSYGSNLTQGRDLHVVLLCADLTAACEKDDLCLSALGG